MSRQQTRCSRYLIRWSLSASLLLASVVNVLADEELRQRASWEWPPPVDVRAALDQWLLELDLSVEQLQDVDSAWGEIENKQMLLDPLMDAVAAAYPAAQPLICQCRTDQLPPSLAELEELLAAQLPPVIEHNLRLLYGKALAMQRMYNEAQDQLGLLNTTDVCDPATLLFYRAAAQFRLRNAAAAKADLQQLLEREADLPVRYATVANLMLADLKQFVPDSLDEIARIMDSIKVRLDHGRAGTRVREEEQEVIDKLSKMIEQLEQQMQQMQAAAQGGANGNQSNNPASDSMLPGGGGPGDVDPKKLAEDSDWGDLPPKQRKQALQELGKDFPAHYRDVIEEYFRNLAKDEANPPNS